MTTENSSLFSLEQLTRTQSAESAAIVDDDSGLIDINRLVAPGTSSAKPAYHQAPPPLGLTAEVVEEATLSGMSAVAARPTPNRWLRVCGYVAAVGLASAVLGLALAKLSGPGEDVAAPAGAPTVIFVAAPAVQPASETTPAGVVENGDQAQLNETTNVPGGEEKAEVADSTVAPPKVAKPKPRPSKPKPADKPKPVAKEPKKPTDPCAHCKGDLACAMRCSVGK